MEDKLKDFERAEYYKSRLKHKNRFIIVFSVFMVIAGFMVARAAYLFL
jgi:uncharacterized membrane protein